MKHFRCGDVVPGCTATFTGAEEEVLLDAAEHTRAEHGVTTVTDEMVATARAALVDA